VFDLAGFTLDGIHLKQCVTLYLFSLPFTLVNELGWATVPVITVVSFTFMGIEGIAEQIEMPFGKRVCYRYMAYKLMGSV
jgi:putative membrane protein